MMIGYHLVGFWGVQREIVLTAVLGDFVIHGKCFLRSATVLGWLEVDWATFGRCFWYQRE